MNATSAEEAVDDESQATVRGPARVSFLEDKLDEGLLYLRVDVIAHLCHL